MIDADSALALSCQGVAHSFSSRNGPVEALGEVSFTAKSHEFVKKDARTAVFSVPVAKDGEAVVTYRVQVKY